MITNITHDLPIHNGYESIAFIKDPPMDYHGNEM